MINFYKLYIKDLKSMINPALNILIGMTAIIIIQGFVGLFYGNMGISEEKHITTPVFFFFRWIPLFFLFFSFYSESVSKTEYQILTLPINRWIAVSAKITAYLTIGALILLPYCIYGTEFWVPDTETRIIWARFTFFSDLIFLVYISWVFLLLLTINRKFDKFSNYRIFLLFMALAVLDLSLPLITPFSSYRSVSDSLPLNLILNKLFNFANNILILIAVIFLYSKYKEI